VMFLKTIALWVLEWVSGKAWKRGQKWWGDRQKAKQREKETKQLVEALKNAKTKKERDAIARRIANDFSNTN